MQEMSLTSFWIIAGSCVLVLGIMILKNRARFALNSLVRAVLGACAIACVNKWLAQQGIMLAVLQMNEGVVSWGTYDTDAADGTCICGRSGLPGDADQ